MIPAQLVGDSGIKSGKNWTRPKGKMCIGSLLDIYTLCGCPMAISYV